MAFQVDLGDDGLFLGFHDLQEVRVAAAFIAKGLSAQRVRQAIALARDLQQASLIVWRWPNIENAFVRFEPPFLFELPVGRSTGLRTRRL